MVNEAAAIVHFVTMDGGMHDRFPTISRRRLAAAVLLAFLFKAMIPAGYMPVAVGAAGMPAMTLCISGLPPGVIKTLALDDADPSAEPQPLHCVFASLAGQAALPHAALAALPHFFYAMHPQPAWPSSFDFPSLVRGPPLGARAPPVYS